MPSITPLSLKTKAVEQLKTFEGKASFAARKAAFEMRSKALAAISKGRKPNVTDSFVKTMTPIIRDLMIVTHLFGWKAARDAQPIKALQLSVFDKTISTYKNTLNLDIDALQKQYDTKSLKIMNDLSKDVEKKLREVTINLIEKGAHVSEAVETLNDTFDALGINPGHDYQLATIFRTQAQLAYGAGRWQADQDPDVQEILWGYEYSAVGDDRTRESHMALDGTILPKEDPFWQTHWPPNGWNCRCVAIPIFEPVDAKPPPTDEDTDPDEGFDFNAGEVFAEPTEE